MPDKPSPSPMISVEDILDAVESYVRKATPRTGRLSHDWFRVSILARIVKWREQQAASLTSDSFIEWAAHWVPDEPPGQRERFATALRAEVVRQRMADVIPKPDSNEPK